MVLSRALHKLICRVLIGVFVFAQLAVAAYACPSLGQATGPMAMTQSEMPAAMMQGDCDQIDQDAANLCAEHCKFGQQSSDTASVPMVFASGPALLYVLPAEDVADVRAGPTSAPAPDPQLAIAPPSHAILHCVLRI